MLAETSTIRNAHRREIRQFLSLHLNREESQGHGGGGASYAGDTRDGADEDEDKGEGDDEVEVEGEEGTPRVYSVGRRSNTTKADIITDPSNGLRLGDGVGIFVDDDLREHMVTGNGAADDAGGTGVPIVLWRRC